ncbi:MAG: hypothetical protein RLZZ70_271 [Candidatus Parcubacteria bacterium]|jgi:hypothetical protein
MITRNLSTLSWALVAWLAISSAEYREAMVGVHNLAIIWWELVAPRPLLLVGWWLGVILVASLVSLWKPMRQDGEGGSLVGLTFLAVLLLGGLPAYEAGGAIWPWMTAGAVKVGGILLLIPTATLLIHGLPIALIWAVWKVARDSRRTDAVAPHEYLVMGTALAIVWPL